MTLAKSLAPGASVSPSMKQADHPYLLLRSAENLGSLGRPHALQPRWTLALRKPTWPGLDTQRDQLPRAEVVDGFHASHCLGHGIPHVIHSTIPICVTHLRIRVRPLWAIRASAGHSILGMESSESTIQPERAFEAGKAEWVSWGGKRKLDYTGAEVGRGIALRGLGGPARDPGRKEVGMLGTACANVLGQDSAGCW